MSGSAPAPLSPTERQQLAEIDELNHVDLAAAAAKCEALIAQCRATRSPQAQVEAARRYGIIMDHLGRATAARDVLYEALQAAQTLAPYFEARLLEPIARSYYTAGEYQTAIQLWGQAIEISEQPGGEAASWMLAKVGLGQVYHALGDHATAVTLHRAALGRIGEVDDPYLAAKIKINLGTNLAQIDELGEARTVLEAALNLCRQHHYYDYAAESYFRLAEIDLREQRVEDAERRLNAALGAAREVNYRWCESNALSALAELYAGCQRLPDALQTIRRAIPISRDCALPHIQQHQHLAAARYAEALGRDAEALQDFKAAYALSEQIQASTAPVRERELQEKAGLRVSEARLLAELHNLPSIDAGDLENAVAGICRQALAILHVGRAAFRKIDDAHTCLQESCVAQPHGLSPDAGLPWRLGAYPAFAGWLTTGELLVAHDALRHPCSRELADDYLRPHGISSLIGLPVRLYGRLHGALFIEHVGPQRNWIPDDIALASQLADVIARAIAGFERLQYRREIGDLNMRLLWINERLEGNVAERTRELEAKNQELQTAMANLVQSEKLASLGNLVAGVAHELNTPIGNALTAASTLESDARQFAEAIATRPLRKQEVEQFLEGQIEGNALVLRNVSRAGTLIQNFKQVAVDTASTRRREFDLRDVLDDILTTLGPQYRRSAHRIDINVPAGITLNSYPGPLEQVITNLVSNSLLHGFDGIAAGTIRITAEDHPEHVQLLYADDGNGIPEHLHRRVFDPFFTTRLGQGGSGLGLYLVYNLVTNTLHGELTLQSAPAEGMRLTMKLPKVVE